MFGSAVGAWQRSFPIPSHVFFAGVWKSVMGHVRGQKVST